MELERERGIQEAFWKEINLIDISLTITYIAGKLNRGLSVIDSYRVLKGEELSEEEIFLASALGWCIEWVRQSRNLFCLV